MHETLLSKEEFLVAEDLGDYFKVKSDNRDLNYNKYFKEGRSNTYCHEVEILGPSKVVYGENGEKILGCGARVVVETDSEYRVIR